MDEQIDVTNCCRLCLSTKLTFNIHTSKKYINSDLPPLCEIIKELTTIQIEKHRGETNVSNNICFSCNYLIIKLYSFRQQSIISNQKFEKALKSCKESQVLVAPDSESKDLPFADSLVAIYGRCLVRAENKTANKKICHNVTEMCKLPSKTNSMPSCTIDSESLPDSALSIALNEHIFNQRPSCIQPFHPSVKKIIEENPNIILSDEAMICNFNCTVVVETFKQLFRAALCPASNEAPNQLEQNISNKSKESCNLTKDNNCSASVVSVTSYSDAASDLQSDCKSRNNSEQCSVCKRYFTNMLLLEEHTEFCHRMKNEAIVLTSQLYIPKRYKGVFLRSIKLIDNEERLKLMYKTRRRIVPVPKIIKNKTVAKSDSTITFKTLDIAESNELLKKLISDTVSSNIPLNDKRTDLTKHKTDLFSSISKLSACNTTNTAAVVSFSNNSNLPAILPKSNCQVVSSTNKLALFCTANKSDVVSPENLPNVHSLTNTKTITSITNKTLKETQTINKSEVSRMANSTVVTSGTVFDYEIHRKRMLKTSSHVCKDTNENREPSSISSSSLLCQEYLPINRPIINNDIVMSNAPLIVAQESVSMNSTTIVNIPDEILKPNFYVDNTVNDRNDSNFKRKNDETSNVSSEIHPKRLKTSKNNPKRIFRDLQGCTNILEKLFAPQLDLEEILRKDLTESDLNEIDTSLINSAVSAYIRKNPRYFNLLEQLVGIRDLPVVVNISPPNGNTFDFIKAKCPSNNSDTPLIDMSRINWHNTNVLQNFSCTKSKTARVVGKSWQKKKINVPLSNWKQCAIKSLATADKPINSVDFEQLIEKRPVALPIPHTSTFTKSDEQLSNISKPSVLNTENNQFHIIKNPSNKSGNKIVVKRILNFTGDKEESSQKAKPQKNRTIFPKPAAKYVIKDRICQQTPYATIVTNNLQQMECTENESSSSGVNMNLEQQFSRDGEIIEIIDDNIQNNYSTNSIIESEMDSLKIVSVMSLNDDYNSSVEKSTEAIVDTQKINEYLNPAPIGIKNVVGSYGILNPGCESANLSTNPTESVSNLSTIEIINISETLQEKNDTVNKPTGISVLSPTRINLLFKKKELKV